MQKAGIFQAYGGSNGPDQPANMISLIKVCLHVVQLFKQFKVDQSADAILYQSDTADVHEKTEPLLFKYEDTFSNGQLEEGNNTSQILRVCMKQLKLCCSKYGDKFSNGAA